MIKNGRVSANQKDNEVVAKLKKYFDKNNLEVFNKGWKFGVRRKRAKARKSSSRPRTTIRRARRP